MNTVKTYRQTHIHAHSTNSMHTVRDEQVKATQTTHDAAITDVKYNPTYNLVCNDNYYHGCIIIIGLVMY